jgi:hypothetical protein
MQVHFGWFVNPVMAIIIRLHDCQVQVRHFDFPAVQINNFHPSIFFNGDEAIMSLISVEKLGS